VEAKVRLSSLGFANGEIAATFSGYTKPTWPITFSPDGKRFATGSEDAVIKIWNLSTGKLIRTLSSGAVTSVVFSPDGRTLISGSKDKTIKV